jgi:hypothetical protein
MRSATACTCAATLLVARTRLVLVRPYDNQPFTIGMAVPLEKACLYRNGMALCVRRGRCGLAFSIATLVSDTGGSRPFQKTQVVSAYRERYLI